MSSPSAFTEACRAGQIDVLKQMLQEDPALVNAGSDGDMPAIIHATCANQIEVVALLLANGADIEAKDSFYKGPALGFAAWHGYADIAKLLVEHGADVDGMGEAPSPLALALDGVDGKLVEEGSPGTTEGHAAIVELLQSRGAKIIGRIDRDGPSDQ